MKRSKLTLNSKGMTLITVLIAVIVLAITTLGVAEVFLRAMRNNGSAGGVSDLMHIAQNAAEKVMLLPDDSALLSGGSINVSSDFPSGLGVNFDHKRYMATCNISQTSIDKHLVKVEIVADYTISYAKFMGVKQGDSQVKVVTYRYKK